jgi:hypothetical protein
MPSDAQKPTLLHSQTGAWIVDDDGAKAVRIDAVKRVEVKAWSGARLFALIGEDGDPIMAVSETRFRETVAAQLGLAASFGSEEACAARPSRQGPADART